MAHERILVTGGAGYIGSTLCPALLEARYAVTVLDNFSHRQNSLAACCAHDCFHVYRGDCRDQALVARLLRNADFVIPLAAIVGAPSCDRDRIAAVTINKEAVVMMARMLSRHQRIVLPMTNSGYGIGEYGKYCDEDSPLRPISLYGTTKVEAEKAVLERGNAITLRLATVFGMSPRMRLDLLVNDFVYRAATDRAVVVFEGHFKRNFVHVRDVARAFVHSLRNFESMKDRPYNVGLDGANLSKIELCEMIQKHVPGFTYFESEVGGDIDKRDYIVSNARIGAAGFVSEWGLDRGIAELLKGYQTVSNSRFGNV